MEEGGKQAFKLPPEAVAEVIDQIAQLWPVADTVEITLEANPTSVEAENFRGYRAAGVNRVSVGVQALNENDLKALGRQHTPDEALKAFRLAAKIFPRVSFDMIYARPQQTAAQWKDELTQALGEQEGHLSLYQLTIEPDTPFAGLYARGKLAIPDAEAAHDFYEATQALTERAGLPAYEISNHAAPGEECRHNLLYWRYGEYAGIGPGAHGRVVIGGQRHATATERQPERWAARVEAAGNGILESTPLSGSEQADEALLMGLRLSEGLDLGRVAAVSGLSPRAGAVDTLIDHGLVERLGPGRLRATRSGRIILNEVVLRLASALEPAERVS